jgi:UDP-N-acetylglucosamine 2-epimerase (non-hydrolysing)
MQLLTIIGTRPEAMKMAPVLLALKNRPGVVSRLCLTGQHPEIAEPVLDWFGLEADVVLPPLNREAGLAARYAQILGSIDRLLAQTEPDRVIVQGDTVSAAAAARAAFLRGIPVAHVEAGLRTHDLTQPWPEEALRREIDLIADLLFAPTPAAAGHLHREAASGRVLVTGNTGVDALHIVIGRLEQDDRLRAAADAALPPAGARPLLLATIHRRENLNGGLDDILAALARIASAGAAEIALPLHPNPVIRAAAQARLGQQDHVHLLPPLGPAEMTRLMQRASLILTDSGGVQEEAPSLGKPVLILRNVTEREEAVAADLAWMVGTEPNRIIAAVRRTLAAPPAAATANPFGDGGAAARIVAALLDEPFSQFAPTIADQEPVPIRLVG